MAHYQKDLFKGLFFSILLKTKENSMNIEVVYEKAQTGLLNQDDLNTFFRERFQDINGDYIEEGCVIVETICGNDKYTFESKDVGYIFSLIPKDEPNLFKDFFEKIIKNNVIVLDQDFSIILSDYAYIDKNNSLIEIKNKFFDYILNQKEVNVSEINLLRLFTQHPEVVTKYLKNDDLSFSQPLYNYLNQHYLYKDLIKNKNIKIIPLKDNTLENFSHELVLSTNYLHEVQEKKINYREDVLNHFLKNTYNNAFNPTQSLERENFSFDKVKITVAHAINAAIPVVQKSIEEIRQTYTPNHPFAKLKK